MAIKNFFGGSIINYGATLPSTTGVPDGALFLKNEGTDAGLYIYRFVKDSNTTLLGDQSAQAWVALTGSITGVNADTLDNLDSTDFQRASALLDAIKNLASTSNGILVKNGSTASVKTIAPPTGNTTITVSNGSGTASGNIEISVNQGGLNLNSIGATTNYLSVAKGGTGANVSVTQGGIIYGATTTTMASTGAGSSGQVLVSNATGAPSWVNANTLTAGSAGSATSASKLSPGAKINGVNFTGENDITISTATANALTFSSSGDGAAATTTFNGSVARTISYNSIGAPSTGGSGASGTWAIDISGTAADATKLETGATINLSGPTANAGYLTTSGAVNFDGSANITIRVSGIDGALINAGTIPSDRLNTSYTNIVDLAASGTVTSANAVLTSTSALLRRNAATTGSIEISSSNAAATGANIKIFSSSTDPILNYGRLRVGTIEALGWDVDRVVVTRPFTATNDMTIGQSGTGSSVINSATVTIGGNTNSTVSVNNNRIQNVGTPLVASDAVNLAAMQGALAGAESSLYQTGAWTPVLRFNGVQFGGTYSSRAGHWFRIGQFVFVTGYITLSSAATSANAGPATITGFPLGTNGVWPGTVSYNSSSGLVARNLQALMNGLTNAIEIRSWSSFGDTDSIDWQYFPAGTILQVSIWYRYSNNVPTTVDFVASPVTGTSPLTVTFSNTSTGDINSYSWNFGDGSPVDTTVSPVHTYSAAGTYTVTLTAQSGSGVPIVQTKTNYITVTAPVGGGGGGGDGGFIDPNPNELNPV